MTYRLSVVSGNGTEGTEKTAVGETYKIVLVGNLSLWRPNANSALGECFPDKFSGVALCLDVYAFEEGAFILFHKTNAKTAEMCKLTENSSRDVQIAFANELSLICDKAGINVWELIALANKHPRVNILQPGCGVGGHCIAVDPYFLTAEFPKESKIIAAAREINNYKSLWCAEKVQNAMLEFELKNGRKPVVAMMGLAFKPNIDDLRESPAKHIVARVMESCNNADILVVEPNVPEHKVFKLTNYQDAFDRADIVVYLVAHNEFKTLPASTSKVILDFCGIFR